jgi:hypothetical protein
MMNKNSRLFLFVCSCLTFQQIAVAQDTSSRVITLDVYTPPDFTALSYSCVISASSLSSYYNINHNPSEEDSATCKKYSKLITALPTQKNHKHYFDVACSLWEMNRISEAKKMFLSIIDSEAAYYTGTYHSGSDIPGDTTTNVYGYGSFTSNYKNYACRYLSKIYIEEKNFGEALKYIQYADKKYPVHYTCGTGHMWYEGELLGLYGRSYEGLEMYDSIINTFLPLGLYEQHPMLIDAIKKKYSQQEINAQLSEAEKSIVYTEESYVSDGIIYTNGSATMTLFGTPVTLWQPQLTMDKDSAKEIYAKSFRESVLYKVLTLTE